MTKKQITKPRNFRLPEETINKLEELSELTGEDMTTILVQAIEQHGTAVASQFADRMEKRVKKIRELVKTAPSSAGVNNVLRLEKKRVAALAAKSAKDRGSNTSEQHPVARGGKGGSAQP